MGCQQSDADAFCKLTMCDETAVAVSYELGKASSKPGFACDGRGTDMGEWFGIPNIHFDSNILSSNGNGRVIKNVVCESLEDGNTD